MMVISCLLLAVTITISCAPKKFRPLPPPSLDLLKGRNKVSLFSIKSVIEDKRNEFYQTLTNKERELLFEILKEIITKDTGLINGDKITGFEKDAFSVELDTQMTRIYDKYVVTCTIGVVIWHPSNAEGEGNIQVLWYKSATRNYDDLFGKGKELLEPRLAKDLIQTLNDAKVIP